jgi:hypothetical protein
MISNAGDSEGKEREGEGGVKTRCHSRDDGAVGEGEVMDSV